MQAVVAAFNQEKALVGAFSVITNLRMEHFEALLTTHYFSPVRHQQRAVLAAVVAEVAHGAGDAGGVAVGGGEGRGRVLGVTAPRCYLSSPLRSYHGST